MRTILLDTHVFLWMQFESGRLSSNLKELMHSQKCSWQFSQISVWEMQIKYDLKKLPLPKPPEELIPDLVDRAGLGFQPLQNEAIFMLRKLPALHRDPFDRLLISTAIVNGWEVATVDDVFKTYPVRTIS